MCRSEATAESVGDLLVGQVMYVAQREGNLLSRRQLSQRRSKYVARRQLRCQVRAFRARRLVALSDQRKRRFGVGRDTLSSGLPQRVSHRNPVDPGVEGRGIAQLVNRTEDMKRDVLGHVRSFLTVVENRARRTQRKAAGSPRKTFGRGGVASLKSPHIFLGGR